MLLSPSLLHLVPLLHVLLPLPPSPSSPSSSRLFLFCCALAAAALGGSLHPCSEALSQSEVGKGAGGEAWAGAGASCFSGAYRTDLEARWETEGHQFPTCHELADTEEREEGYSHDCIHLDKLKLGKGRFGTLEVFNGHQRMSKGQPTVHRSQGK